MNTFGSFFRLTTFGESHGPVIGGVIDGLPAGVMIDRVILDDMLARRRPGTSSLVSARREDDVPEFLSGLTADMISLGSPIAFIVRNRDQRSADYDDLADIYRPNHADFTTEARYGLRDHRGGGRASARTTLPCVVGGAIAMSWLEDFGIMISSRLISAGEVEGSLKEMEGRIESARRAGDSVGGVVEITALNVPPGVGTPQFGKLHAMIAAGLMSINGVKGVEYGDGFQAAHESGSCQADSFIVEDGRVGTATNHSGGIQGGISNGMPIIFRAAFKPTPTIARPLRTINRYREEIIVEAKGRHDPCIAVRGAVVAEAMMAMAIADAMLEAGFRTDS